MVEVIFESTPVARKSHNCMASEYILNGGINGFGYTISELRSIVKAQRNSFQIIKGQKYINQFNKCYGEVYSFKAIPAMHDLCVKYDLYEF